MCLCVKEQLEQPGGWLPTLMWDTTEPLPSAAKEQGTSQEEKAEAAEEEEEEHHALFHDQNQPCFSC